MARPTADPRAGGTKTLIAARDQLLSLANSTDTTGSMIPKPSANIAVPASSPAAIRRLG